MKKLYFLSFIFLVVALGVSFPAYAQRKESEQLVASFDRLGPIKIGMTASQASKVLGVPVTRDAGYEGGSCYYTSPKRGYKNIAFMMNGRLIARIDIDNKTYKTDRGAKIGDTEAKIKQLYKGMYKVYNHSYVDSGHYIEVTMKGGKYSIIFETDGKTVTTFRLGKPEQVGYVEGCS
jgi:outer membrane protein assembly factor BamE (lipoprotein component of BamABCDE complex)